MLPLTCFGGGATGVTSGGRGGPRAGLASCRSLAGFDQTPAGIGYTGMSVLYDPRSKSSSRCYDPDECRLLTMRLMLSYRERNRTVTRLLHGSNLRCAVRQDAHLQVCEKLETGRLKHAPPLERELGGKLNLPGIELTQDAAEIRLVDDAADQVEVRVIRQVEKLRPELRTDAICDAELAGNR